MWASSHVAVGVAIYEGVKDKPRWVKWPVVVVGGFISHWLLDSIGVYHDLDTPFAKLIAALAGCCIALLWWLSSRQYQGWQKILPPPMISGAIAWLIWDYEWIFPLGDNRWLHFELLSHTAAGMVRPTEAHSTLIELLLTLTVMFMAIPRLIGLKGKQLQLRTKSQPQETLSALGEAPIANGRHPS